MWNPNRTADSDVRPVVDHESKRPLPALDARGYDRSSGEICREVISFSGLPPIRLQLLPEQ